MSVEENKAIVKRYLDEAWNKGNVNILDEVASPNYARYVAGQDKPLDREGQKQRITGFRKAMPDLHLSIDDLFGEGDRVVFRVTVRGTQQEPFMGAAPTGKQITVPAIDIVRIADGKIADHWGLMDTFGLRQQLGL